MTIAQEIKIALQDLAVPGNKDILQRFFKTGIGEYGEGDQFIGVPVPDQRKVVKEYASHISMDEIKELLVSEIHEHRHCGLLLLVSKFDKSKNSSQQQSDIVQFYLQNKKHINNWDLVDNSCHKILGRYCYENNKEDVLLSLADEENLWSKRIAVVSTLYYVKRNSLELVKNLVLRNMTHTHDLMHKANGWLLRELGKKNEQELLNFLDKHYQEMPRTTLRYSIEKFDELRRKDYLKSRI